MNLHTSTGTGQGSSLVISDIDNAQSHRGRLLLPAFPYPSLKTEIKPPYSECPILSPSPPRKYECVADGCKGEGDNHFSISSSDRTLPPGHTDGPKDGDGS